MKQDHTSILGSEISVLNLDETCDKILELSSSSKSHYICVSNVHTVVEGYHDPVFAKITNEATLATADGVPLIWASKFLNYSPIHGRASGPDVLARILSDKKYSSLKHYFYGSTPEVLGTLEKNLRTQFPSANYSGFFSPPIRQQAQITDPLTIDEVSDCKRIIETGANIVWVGLGAPKQEIWMHRAYHIFPSGTVLLGVGAAFDFLSGNKKRAPVWMQKTGLEWFHRMISEPGRLTSRYMKTNPVFVAAILKQLISKK